MSYRLQLVALTLGISFGVWALLVFAWSTSGRTCTLSEPENLVVALIGAAGVLLAGWLYWGLRRKPNDEPAVLHDFDKVLHLHEWSWPIAARLRTVRDGTAYPFTRALRDLKLSGALAVPDAGDSAPENLTTRMTNTLAALDRLADKAERKAHVLPLDLAAVEEEAKAAADEFVEAFNAIEEALGRYSRKRQDSTAPESKGLPLANHAL